MQHQSLVFNITHRCQHHIYKEGNSNLVHTTNININTEIVLFGGKCPTPQTGLWSVPVNDAISCEVCVPVTPKEIYSSATSKISGSSNKLWVTTFYLYTVVVDSFLFSLIALQKEKKKKQWLYQQWQLICRRCRKNYSFFGYCVIVTEVPSTTFCILLIYKLYFIHTFVYLILSKFSSINYKPLSTILLFTILACTLSD